MANVEVRTAPAEIDELLPGASVLVVPSQMPDPWPRVAFEGMAAGVPVLASDTGGLRESVPASQRVSPHDDPDAWGAALNRLRDPVVWEGARTNGRRAAAAILATRPRERFVRAVETAAQARAGALKLASGGLLRRW
jgi:glycosyltransferase involved in cell wall biosynthesis